MTLDKDKFPIGQFKKTNNITDEILNKWIFDISTFPDRLRAEVTNLTEEQLDTKYRAGGWTVRQVVNHCADSHINSLVRLKLSLTEDKPTIKPYYEDRWAELLDSKKTPIEPALKMLDGIHQRWAALLRGLTNKQLKRTFVHPYLKKEFTIEENTGVYAWHCNHHLAHITTLKKTKGWK